MPQSWCHWRSPALALWQRGEAVRQADLSRSRELASVANVVVSRQPELALLLAREGVRAADTPEATDALRTALVHVRVLQRLHHGGVVNRAVFLGESDTVATAGQDRAVRLWDSRSGRREAVLSERGPVFAAEPRGFLLVALDRPDELAAVSEPRGELPLRVRVRGATIITSLGGRVQIRPVRVSDAQALASLYLANREFLRPFEPERPGPFFSTQGQRERAQLAADGARAGTLLRFVILDEQQQLAGMAGVENIIRGAAQTGTLSYWVDRRRNGRGIASSAVAAVVEEAFGSLGLHRLEAPTLVDNLASQRVLEKNRFEPIGLARHYLHIGGAWRDHVLFQRICD